MYKILCAHLEEGTEETFLDWRLWDSFSNLYEALFWLADTIRRDVEDDAEPFAYRLVIED